MLQAQTLKREKMYRFIGEDSVLQHQKERREDSTGALLSKKDYFYNGTLNQNPLWKEETANYSDGILTQYITTYPPNDEPNTERLETKYMKYVGNDDSCKTIWVRKYDFSGELLREDTSTYDKKNLLIKRCSYIFVGSTSLVCTNYKYNKKGLLCSEKEYIHWNTISIRGRAKEKKSVRGEYKYKYNKRGQRVSGKGTYRKAKYKEVKKYDEKGLLTYNLKSFQREEKTSKAALKKIKNDKRIADSTARKEGRISTDTTKQTNIKKVRIVADSSLQIYADGLLLEDIFVESNNRKRHLINTYDAKDLIKSEYRNSKNKVVELREFSYAEKGKLKQEKKQKFDEGGTLRYEVIYTFGDGEQLLTEEQTTQGRRISLISYTYDKPLRPTSKTTENAGGKVTERVYYAYE
jgi:hypothetical protein